MATKKNLYPTFIIVTIISFLFFLGWSAMRAAESGPEVTDADYYSKGLRYTSTLLEKKAAESLGWQVTTRLSGRTLVFHLTDKTGLPVREAKGVISLFLPGTTRSVKYHLEATETGTYKFNLTERMKGEMNARLEFEREGARLSRQLLLNL